MSLRDALVAGAAALAATAMLALPVSQRLEGLSVDVLHWLEQGILGPRHTPESSPVVVIAIDETTYRTPPFRDVPKVMWTREIAGILDAVREAGADVVGFDVIFPTSLQKHVPGVDREFLVALRDAARQGKVVLGKVQHSDKPIAPFAAQSFAVGHSKNIRILNLHEDPDGIIRRVPLFFNVEAKDGSLRREPSMALELAARSLGSAPETGAQGELLLAGREVPGAAGNALALHFDAVPATIPTYSFADLHACAESGNGDYFLRQFAGKAVLFGVVLDIEDRKLSSLRLVGVRDGVGAPAPCALTAPAAAPFVRDSVPGVYIQASAVSNLIRGDALDEFGPATYALLSLPLAALVGFIALLLAPVSAAAGSLAGFCIWSALAVGLFRNGVVLPLLDPMAAGGLTYVALLAYRYFIRRS